MTQPPERHPPRDARPPQESDEDLFDFDEPSHGAAKPASERPRGLDDSLERVGKAAKEVASTLESKTASVARPVAAAKSVAPIVAPTQGIVHHRLRPTPLLIGLLAVLVAFQLGAMFVSWRSLRAVETVILDLGHEVADSTKSLKESIDGQAAATDATNVFGALPEGYRTLELAKERIDRGEFGRARRALHGLLAVVDRIEDPARQDVEARASALIAQSYGAEALVAQARAERADRDKAEEGGAAAEGGR
jgi:hypothetical protein